MSRTGGAEREDSGGREERRARGCSSNNSPSGHGADTLIGPAGPSLYIRVIR